MDDKFKQKSLSSDALVRKLRGCSPLQASKVLIEAELFEKKGSLQVLDEIYDSFDSKESLIDELVTPIGLNLLDGILSHKKLKLNRTGLTASRLWSEIKGFDYSASKINASALSAKQQLEAIREPRPYDEAVRREMTKRKNLEANKDKHFGGKPTAESSIEMDENGKKKELYRLKKDAISAGKKSSASDSDHLLPVKQISDQFANNSFLTNDDISVITDADYNLIEISNELNRMKGAGSFQDLYDKKKALLNKKNSGAKLSSKEKKALKKLESISDQTLKNGIEKEKESSNKTREEAQKSAIENIKNNKKAIIKKAGKQATEQTSYELLGTAIIEAIKPIFYELMDSFENGFEIGVKASSLGEAIKIRFSRIMSYLREAILPTLKGAVNGFFNNISKVLIEGIIGLVEGLFKSVMRIISEGFSAMISALKVLSSKDMSAEQKGDAIVKILASTVTTFVTFYFSEYIISAIPKNLDFLEDIFLAIMSGVASTLVVYLIDKVDIFSIKHEKRSKLVEEIFQHRIATIKKNTDVFSAVSIQELATQKLAFRKLYADLQAGIDNDVDVTRKVNSIADFMKIEVDIRDSETFLEVLKREKVLVI